MQDRRNHWREASFQQNRFSNAESFSSYPVDQNELSLISEQERVVTLLPVPNASPSAYKNGGFVWEPPEHQSNPDHDRYSHSVNGNFHSDSPDIGWSMTNPIPCQPLMQVDHRLQYEPPPHQSSMQDHTLCDQRLRREVQEYSSPHWNGRNLFEIQDENDEYGSGRYSHSDRADVRHVSYSGVKPHAYGGARDETCIPYPCDNARYHDHVPVERGPEERFGRTEDTAVDVHRHHPHLEIHAGEHILNPLLPGEHGYLERGGADTGVAVPLFLDDRQRYCPDSHPVNVSVQLCRPRQRGRAGVHGQRSHRPGVRFNGGEVIAKPPKKGHVEAIVLKSGTKLRKARRNRIPSQAALSPMDHVSLQTNAQFRPSFKTQPASPDNSLDDLRKQVESRAAVVTVRNAAKPLEVEEGELVDDSDDEGALVIDESEDHERGRAGVSKKRTDGSQNGQSQQSLSVAPVNKFVSSDISQRIESEIQQAKEASIRVEIQQAKETSIRVEGKGNYSMSPARESQTQESRKDDATEDPGLYPMDEPELLASELLKQPEFVRQLCVRTGQKFSSFSLLWQAAGRVTDILNTASDQNSIKAFQAYVAQKLPKCYLKSQPFSSNFSDQGLLYRKEVEFFDIHYHGDVALWKKNILQYYRHIVQYHATPLQSKNNSTKTSSSDHLPLVSSQLVGSVGHCSLSKGTEPTEELLRKDHFVSICAPKHHADESQGSIVQYSNGFHGTSSRPSLFFTNPPGSDHRGAEGPAGVHTQTTGSNLATEPSALSGLRGVRSLDNQSIQQEQLQGIPLQYADEVSITPIGNRHTGGSSFGRSEVMGSHEEAVIGDCGPCAGTLATGMQDMQPQGLQDVQSYPAQSECQYAEQAFQPLQPSAQHSRQMESVQREEQCATEQCEPVQLASTHHIRDTNLSHVSSRLLDQGPSQQHNYYSSFSPSSDAFMPLHVTSDASGPRADHLEFGGSTMESGAMELCGGHHGNHRQQHPNVRDGGHHGNQLQQHPHTYNGGDMGYHGRDLHTSRREPSESVGAYHQRASNPSTDDQPYDPALPLMDLTSFQGNSQSPHYSERLHLGHHSTHVSASGRDHRAVKSRSHFSTPYASSASNVQAFARSVVEDVEFGSGRGARKSQHDVVGSKHVSGDHMRPLERKGLACTSFSGHKRKRRKQWAPRMSKKQRKRSQHREGRMEEMFMPSGGSNGGRVGQEHTAKPSSSYERRASVVGSKERKNYYSSTKNDCSDEDLEVLELRKEVIMSIVSNNAGKAMKRALAAHKPAGGEGVEVQDLHSPRDDKPSAAAFQPDVEEVGVVQATCTKEEAVDSSPSGGTTLPGVQLQQKDIVVEVPSAPAPAAVSGIDRLFKSTPVHSRGEESPVMSPRVTALRKGEQTNKSRSASPLQKPKPNTAIKVVPRDSQTHKVQDFSILISNSSDTSDSEVDIDGPLVPTGQHSGGVPTSEDINQLVQALRKDSENEQRIVASQQTGMLKLLPLGQQQEYNELQLRLALYKKRSKKGLQMGPKAKAKATHVKRGSAPAVLVSKQLKAKTAPLLKAADVSEIKNRIEMCDGLIKDHKSSIETEMLAQDKLLKQQVTLEQQIDESALRIELLEKKLKDTREEHKTCETVLTETRSKVVASKEVISKHTSCIKEKENEVRLLQRRLKMSQQQSDSLQVMDSTKPIQSVTDTVVQPISNDITNDQGSLVLFSSNHVCEAISPSYPQYESVSDAEETCGNGLHLDADNFQPSTDDVSVKEYALSPLETEMVSDPETVESTSAQNSGMGVSCTAPSIMVEMVSDSEDVSGQLGKDANNLPAVGLQSENTTGHRGQVIEEISDTDEWCLVFNGDDNSAASTSGVAQCALIGSTSSGIYGSSLFEPTSLGSSLIEAVASASGQSSPVVTEPHLNADTIHVSSEVHSEKRPSLQHILSSSCPTAGSVPEAAVVPSIAVSKLPMLATESKLTSHLQLEPVNRNSLTVTGPNIVGNGSVATSLHTKIATKKTGIAAKGGSQHPSAASVISKLPPLPQNSSHNVSKPSAENIHLKAKQLGIHIPLNGGRANKNIVATKTLAASGQLKTNLRVPSQGIGSSPGNKLTATHNPPALHKMRLSTSSSSSSSVNQKLLHKANPKRLVHSKVADLHGRLQKELLALEALKTARKVKSSVNTKIPAKGTQHVLLQKNGVASPTSSPVAECGASVSAIQHAEMSDQLKQVVKLFGMQCLPRGVFKVPSKPDLNVLLDSPVVATFSITPVSFESLLLIKSSVGARVVPEHIIVSAEKLMRQQHHRGDPKERVPLAQCTGYVSPLLAFRSYRLSPHFTKFASLSSLTYSNKIDPSKMMCRFELLGSCNDPGCPAQHFKDIKLLKEEMARDLVSYCPALAGCSEDVSFVDDSLPDTQQKISAKVDMYAKGLCDSFSAKLSDEQLCLYIAHKVTLGRREVAGSSGIDLDERAWCLKPGTSQQVKSLKEALPFSDMVTHDVSKGPGWSVGVENSYCSHLQTSPVLQRYYTAESAVVDMQSPCDPSGWVRKAQKTAQAGSLDEACDVLKQGQLAFPLSEEIWVHLLQAMHSCRNRSGEHQKDTTHPEDLWSKAVKTCPSYSVIFECVRQASTYGAKRNLIVDGVKILITKSCNSVEEKSYICLELLLNAVLLEQMCGAHEQAIEIMRQALLSQSDESSHSVWIDIKSNLIKEDLVFACLCFGHYVYHTCLPLTVLFGCDGACPPARIINKDPFLIPLNSDRGSEKHEWVMQLFQDLLTDSLTQHLSDASHRMCNVLCQNLVQLEAACSNLGKVQTLLTKLLTTFPSTDGVWLLQAKLSEQKSAQECIDTLSEAVTRCPQSPDIYCYAASVLQATGRNNEATDWLKSCVVQFYEIPEGVEVALADCFILYRKLLGQLVPYQYNFPPFSSFVDVKKLGLDLVSLWKCYILLIKLSQPHASREHYHSSAEDAFESAVHSVHDELRLKLLWREYLTHLRLQALDNPTVHNFKVFADCVERCIEAVKYQGTFSYPLIGQPSEYRDYAFHNEVLGLFLDCCPVNSNCRLFYITKYLKLLPKNSVFVSRLVQCALTQNPEEIELAQVVLANYLAEDPTCCILWKMAISLELRLGHTREVRWMYRQATMILPLQADLWKEFLLFELHELQNSHSSPSIISWLVERCNQVGLDLIPFAKKAISQS